MTINKFFAYILILFCLSSCKVGRFLYYNFADINDYKKFPSREINNQAPVYNFPENLKDIYKDYKVNNILFETFLENSGTVAFLIIKKDTIVYENYFHKHDKENIVPSFSMAKSILSILVGCAIDDQLIQSVDDPIINYLPELNQKGFEKIKIKHLLQMTSGVKFKESYYNPFGEAASFYYGRQLRKDIKKLKVEIEPGKRFSYSSGDTQLLGLVLESALKTKTLSAYLEEKIWKPLGMQYNASWSIDKKKNGMEKTFCCINARARDFAKIGRLYKNKGVWEGQQIISKSWVDISTKKDSLEGSSLGYQYQWWLTNPGHDFRAEGILGQFVYVHPEKDLIIVRLGKKYGKVNWNSIFSKFAEHE
jgi:CubicO group peptidase (beta-lactamase class C family)